MATAKDRFDVFLSYNSVDKPDVEAVAQKLRSEGLNPWFDKWRLIPVGHGLADRLRECPTCAVFIGRQGHGDWSRAELLMVQDRANKETEFLLIPILLPGVPDPFDYSKLPPFLAQRTWVDFRPGLDEERALHALVNAIRREPPGPDASGLAANEICPYRGLEPFNEGDARFFFGRAGDIQRLLEKFKTTRFLAVLGASGSGKSSLVRAGLIPALKRAARERSRNWKICVIKPGSHPLTTLAAHLSSLCPQQQTIQRTLDVLGDDERTLHLGVALALTKEPSARIVWVIDQFEEIFTLCKDEKERAPFLANLLYASAIPDGQCSVLLTMRADFLPKCAAYRDFATRVAAQQFLVGQMDLQTLRQAVREPARLLGNQFEPGLVDTILDDLARESGALPLLEHALLEIWKRRSNRTFTLDSYRNSGGVAGAIARTAEEIYEGFSADEQVIVRRIMMRLTHFGEGTEDTRRRAVLDELVSSSGKAEAVQRVVQKMVGARFLTTTWDRSTSKRYVDVSHEALIRGWSRLRDWIDQDRAGLRLRRHITGAAENWQQSGRDEKFLFRGARLIETQEWQEVSERDLEPLEREFLRESEVLEQRLLREEMERRQAELNAARKLAESERSRAEEERKRADVETKRANEQQRAAKRQRAFFGAFGILVLILCGLAALFRAKNGAAVANRLEVVAEMDETDADGIEAEIYDAALADRLMAKEKLAQGDGPAAFAYLSRALTYRPASTLAAEIAVSALNTWQFPPPSAICRGHSEWVTSAEFSPDGLWIVTASADGTAQVWEAQSGKQVAVLQGHSDALTSAKFSPDGRQIVTASWDNTARVWEAQKGEQMAVLQGHESAVYGAEFSPDGRQIVTASWDNTARVWEARKGEQMAVLQGHEDWVYSATFSYDGQWIVTASDDRTARVWETQSGKQMAVLQGHEKEVRMAEFSPDGQWIVTASADGTARVWESQSGKQAAKLQGHEDKVTTAKFSPDGQRIVTASWDATARVWETRSGKQLNLLQGHEDRVTSARFSPDGQLIVTGSDDRTARLWEAQSGKQVAKLQGHERSVNSAEFSRDGQRIVTASDDRTARVWETRDRERLVLLQGHKDELSGAEFSPDSRQIVTASSDGTARVWETRSGKQLAVLEGHWLRVESAKFSPDGQRIVTASWDGTARVWEVQSGSQLAKLQSKESTGSTVFSAEFSPDGRRIVTASWDNTARVWEAQSGELVAELRGHEKELASAEFSPDGRRIVTASWDGTARVWDAQTGKQATVLEGHEDWVHSAEFSRDGQWIVTASDDRTARVWETQSGDLVAVLKGHENRVNSAEFSPDGQRIVTASADGTAREWEAQSGKQVALLQDHSDALISAQFSPDGQRILTASADGTARVWEAQGGSQVAVLRGHESAVYRAEFSPDGHWIVTASRDGTARVWIVRLPSAGNPPPWFRDFLNYMGQLRLNARGELVLLPTAEWIQLRENLRNALRAENRKDTPYLAVLRRFVTE